MFDRRPEGPAHAEISQALRRRRFIYAGGTAALLGLVAGVALYGWGDDTRSSGAASFWRRRFDLLDGRAIQAQSLLGRPLLVNFWATWCPPCIEEMPLIDRFYLEYRSKNHQVLGIAIDKPSTVSEFVRRVQIQYPLAIDPATGPLLARELGNLSGGLPFSVFFNGEGKVARRKMGKLSTSDLQAWGDFEN